MSWFNLLAYSAICRASSLFSISPTDDDDDDVGPRPGAVGRSIPPGRGTDDDDDDDDSAGSIRGVATGRGGGDDDDDRGGAAVLVADDDDDDVGRGPLGCRERIGSSTCRHCLASSLHKS